MSETQNQTTDASGPNTPATLGACRVLSLDGGGAKGFYTLGILKEIEAMVGLPLSDRFHLIFGTSTGAIIAALLALGYKVDDILALYQEHVPTIMSKRTAAGRTAALHHLAGTVFKDLGFDAFKTGIGIVATHWQLEKPMIFKASVAQAHGRQATFQPGFGCKIGEAIEASCSAYPFFERPTVKTGKGELVELADGGYCANNPTLYAIADAVMALKKNRADLRVVSLGVGTYPEPKYRGFDRWIRRLKSVRLLQKTLNVNTSSMEQLRFVLFKEVPTIRINETFAQPEMATDLMESNLLKLNVLYQRGRESFAHHEQELRAFLQ
jgi:patatin-like phospholipase/acyl hydrolase